MIQRTKRMAFLLEVIKKNNNKRLCDIIKAASRELGVDEKTIIKDAKDLRENGSLKGVNLIW